MRLEKGVGASRIGITDSCESPDVDAGVLLKSMERADPPVCLIDHVFLK